MGRVSFHMHSRVVSKRYITHNVVYRATFLAQSSSIRHCKWSLRPENQRPSSFP